MPPRPEQVAAPEVFYGAQEAKRYTQAARPIQEALTKRSLELAGLLPRHTPKLLLDIGCGSGLSGEVCTELGYHWMGADISHDMLQLAADTHSRPQHPAPCGMCCGLLHADMGRSLGFNIAADGLFDGAISISAVQWLLAREDWWEASVRFFSALHRLLVPGAMAVLQVYVVREHEIIKLLHAAVTSGFHRTSPSPALSASGGHASNIEATCCVLVDFPHNTAAKKYSLVLQRPTSSTRCSISQHVISDSVAGCAATPATGPSSAGEQQAADGGGIGVAAPGQHRIPAPECPLAWHVGGTCSLWWQSQHQQNTPDNANTDQQGAQRVVVQGPKQGGRCDAFCVGQHQSHGRRLARLLQRAAVLPPAPPGQTSPCCKGDFSTASEGDGQAQAAHTGGKRRRQQPTHQHPPACTAPQGASGAAVDIAPQSACPAAQHEAPCDEHQHQPGALRQWLKDHERCCSGGQSAAVPLQGAMEDAAPPAQGVKVTAFVRCTQLYPCGGHVCVTVLAGPGLPVSQAEQAQELVARVCGVEVTAVGSVKVEVPLGTRQAATAHPHATKSRQADSDPSADHFLGARISYHSAQGIQQQRQGHQQVWLGTLQAPGVLAPYCVMDACWMSVAGSSQPVVPEDAKCSEDGGSVQSGLQAAAGDANRLLSGATGDGSVNGMAAVAVLLEVRACTVSRQAGAVCCRMLAALWDTCSSHNLEHVAHTLLDMTNKQDAGDQQAQVLPAGVQKQLHALRVLDARLNGMHVADCVAEL